MQARSSSTGTNTRNYSLFDDEEGEDWQQKPHDRGQQDPDCPAVHAEAAYDAVNHDGESVQVAINSRFMRTTRLTFFDDESGEEDQQYEPDDYNLVTGLVDKRGCPDFSKAKKFDGAWLGMVFKRGTLGLGYYRDVFKLDIRLGTLLPAAADAAPIVLQLNEVISRDSSGKRQPRGGA